MNKYFRLVLVGIAFLAAWLVVANSMAAPLTAAEAAKLLNSSVAELKSDNKSVCTVSKIGPKEFLSARHCFEYTAPKWSIQRDFHIDFVRFVTSAAAKKSDNVRKEDWAVARTFTDNPNLKPLELSCAEEVYEGMPVAYMGYPGEAGKIFSVGYVSSVSKVRNKENSLDFTVDLQAAPGASGSPIISLDTGKIVGILTEGVHEGRRGFYLIGVESIKAMPQCDSKN